MMGIQLILFFETEPEHYFSSFNVNFLLKRLSAFKNHILFGRTITELIFLSGLSILDVSKYFEFQ